MLLFGKTNRLPVMLQAEAAECGLCCLAMVAGYFGYHTDLVTLRREIGVSMRGITLKSLMQMSEHLHLSPRPLKLSLDEVPQLKLPAILHWNLDHYVVLSKVGRDKITIHDPAVGKRSYSFAEAGQHFSGIALELSPRTEFLAGNHGDKLRLWSFWSGAQGLRGSLLQILLLSFFVQLFSLAVPFYMQVVVDDVLVKHDQDLLTLLAFGFILLTLTSVATKALREFSSLYLANQLNYNIGNSVLHHLIRLPMEYFESRHIGDVISRFDSLKPIQHFITGSSIAVVVDGLLAVSTLSLMLVYSPFLAGVVLLAVSLYALFRVVQFRPLRNANHENIAAIAKLDSLFIESIRALQSIKLNSKETERQNSWRNQFANSINTEARIGRLQISYGAANNLLTGTEYVIVIFLGAKAVIANEMSIGMLYAFMAYRTNFSDAIISVVNQLLQYWMLGLHLERVSDITKSALEPGLEIESTLVLPVSGEFEAKNLSYRYSPTDPLIFSNFSLRVPQGSFVALYGPSGVGKTTLLKVLMGLLEPESGQLEIDGIPLVGLGTRSYRKNIAAVMQSDSLFSGSVRENIVFFDASPDLAKIKEACEQAEIHADIVSSPMGYDSLIGDMGSSLSGGQQQRILIARALYQCPKILFLDEGTAHVDSATEQKIMSNLKSRGLTCVYVTHNPDLLNFADQIVEWTGFNELNVT
jgi:ATP-binding cassette subfamily B protein RaxB